jgi:hypothetical protein
MEIAGMYAGTPSGQSSSVCAFWKSGEAISDPPGFD